MRSESDGPPPLTTTSPPPSRPRSANGTHTPVQGVSSAATPLERLPSGHGVAGSSPPQANRDGTRVEPLPANERSAGDQAGPSASPATPLMAPERLAGTSPTATSSVPLRTNGREDAQARQVQQLQHTIRELTLQLHSVAEFVDMKEDIEDRLRSMQRYYEAEVARHIHIAKEARLALLENRVQLRTVEEDLRASHMADVDRTATALLDSRTKEVLQTNASLVKDKTVLAGDAEQARQHNASLMEENRRLRREAELTASTESELLSRSVRQKREIAALKKQVKSTEDRLNEVVEAYEAKLAKRESVNAKRVEEAVQQRDRACRDAEALHRELVKVRELSTCILKQRSELEEFFHEALRHVRGEIVEERRRQIASVPSGFSPGASAAQTIGSSLRLEQQSRLLLSEHHHHATSPSTSAVTTFQRQPRLWGSDKRGFPVLIDGKRGGGGGGGGVDGTSYGAAGPRRALPPIPPYAKSPKEAATSTNGSSLAGSGQDQQNGALVALHGSEGSLVRHAHRKGYDDYDKERTALATNGAALIALTSPGCTSGEDELPLSIRPERDDVQTSLLDSGPLTLRDLPSIPIQELNWAEKERVIMLLFHRLRQQQQVRQTVASRSKAKALASVQPPRAITAADSMDAASASAATAVGVADGGGRGNVAVDDDEDGGNVQEAVPHRAAFRYQHDNTTTFLTQQ